MKLLLLQLCLLVPIVTSLRLNCNFGRNSEAFYLCQISNLRVDSTNTTIEAVSGFHQKRLNNKNVTGIVIEDSPSMEFMPKAIDQFFSSIVAITVFNAGLSVITEDDMQPFPNLRFFALENCKITSLEFRLFLYNPELKVISFRYNQLATIDDRVFDYIDDLEKLDLSKNVCVNKKANDRYEVRRLIKEISAKCQQPVEGPANWMFDVDCVSSNVSSDGRAPFLVALKQRSDSKLVCSGLLITNKHILTSAHCVHPKQVELGLGSLDIEVQLGRNNVNTGSDTNFESRNVQSIFINDNYKYDSLKHDGDFAVLVMEQPVIFSSTIGPICLTRDLDIRKQVDGFVVGWGSREGSSSLMDNPQRSPAHSISDGLCFETQSDLGRFYTTKMFCALEDEFDQCRADLARAFVISYHNKVTLRALFTAGNEDCETKKYSLFTKITEYADWVKKTVEANP